MATSPRFGFDDLLGNEVADFQVLDTNFDLCDAYAAHLSLANIFAGAQTFNGAVTIAGNLTLNSASVTGTGIGSAASKVAAGNHTHGSGGYTGAATLEALYATPGTVIIANTGQTLTADTVVMYVFATASITITLPNPTTTTRPITVEAGAGQVNINAAGGSTVFGGSPNTTTGAIQNGVLNTGDSLTYKSNGTNWRAVG